MLNLENFFIEKNITSIGFDLDNTIFDTDPYYIRIKDAIFKDFVTAYFPKEQRDEVFKKLDEFAAKRYDDRYLNGLKPILIHEEYSKTILEFFPKTSAEEIDRILKPYTEDFYHKSPPLFAEAIEFLNLLSRIPTIRNIFGATDAQEDWSRIKAECVLENTELKEFPFFSTDLSVRKDADWWSSIFPKLGESPENVMIVGDNYHSDIYTSALAGVKLGIWVNRRGKSMDDVSKYILPEDSEMIVVKDLNEILSL